VGSRIELIRSRKGFYRDNYSRGCIALLVALMGIVVLSALIIYLAVFRPVSDFYATSTDGRITRLVSLDTPRASA
jgi:hypothetical protein